jgi:HEAT repeat protein
MPLIRKPPGTTTGERPPDTAAIRAALASGNEDQRWSAARAAASLPDAVAAVAEALAREQSSRVREALFTALARIATPQSIEAVLPFLRSDDASVRIGACDALSAMKDAAWPHVAPLLRDPSADIRVLACELTRTMPSEQAVPLFCALLDNEPEPNVCAAAIDALAELGRAEALPALARCRERFRATPFLGFAISVAEDRIRSQSAGPRA